MKWRHGISKRRRKYRIRRKWRQSGDGGGMASAAAAK